MKILIAVVTIGYTAYNLKKVWEIIGDTLSARRGEIAGFSEHQKVENTFGALLLALFFGLVVDAVFITIMYIVPYFVSSSLTDEESIC